MTLFRKIRERRRFKVALSYVGGAWVALEVTDQLTSRSVVPELVYQIVLMWVIVGVPAALLIGWYHGEKGDQKAPRSEIVDERAPTSRNRRGSPMSSMFEIGSPPQRTFSS